MDEDAHLEAQYEDRFTARDDDGWHDEEDDDYEPCGAPEGASETCDAPCVPGEDRCAEHLERVGP